MSPRSTRPLKVFAFDPSVGRNLHNHLTLHVPYEPLDPGPIGRLVAVIDQDRTSGRTFDGIDLDDPQVLMRGGFEPSQIDRSFHLQMTYAIAMHIIHRFEIALGRPTVWRWAEGKDDGDVASKLRIYPHAEEMANAYCLPEKGELHCGYVRAPDGGRGTLPGQYVYTCLSFGVIAHELGHVLLATVLDHNPEGDAGAFAEAFADLIAVLQRLTFPELVAEIVRRGGGRLHSEEFQPELVPESQAAITAELGTRNPLHDLAGQLGEALGAKLRTPLGVAPGTKLEDVPNEPHARGAVLVAAVSDAFFTVYTRRTHDLLRIAGYRDSAGVLHPDLAQRLANEASKTARHLLNICIRALDYCPPASFTLGEYLRAMVTADYDLVPTDDWGYRDALIDAFLFRGIYPGGVPSAEEQALRWPFARDAVRCKGLVLRPRTAEEGAENLRLASEFVAANRDALGLPHRKFTVLRVNASEREGVLGRVECRFAIQLVSDTKSAKRRTGATVVLDGDGSTRWIAQSLPSSEPRAFAGALPDAGAAGNRERPLKIYAFDPTQGRSLGNHLTVRVPFEDLDVGPIGARVAVIDYDASNDRYYAPVDLNDPQLLLRGGLDPSESDPQFHQQMVYAVASETVRAFEVALGRPIKWRWARKDRDPVKNALRIFPHAMQEANAYFDPELCALLFGYFEGSVADPGSTLPGQAVFTCLSHDIVAHETVHALLDTVKRKYLEPSGVDVLAFHEAFADIVSLFQHFSYKNALLETIQRTGGRIYAGRMRPLAAPGDDGPAIQAEIGMNNPMVDLARQFGEALGTRAALRGALGTPPNSSRLAETLEPHDRGAILVAAIFDAFFTVYVRRTEDLLRLASYAPGTASSMSPDLADRLAREASKTARHFLTICVRALDYSPPVDIEFGDFLRAIVTADRELVPEDTYGYRSAIIEAFRSRGIYPRGARSLSEDGLVWPGPQTGDGSLVIDPTILGSRGASGRGQTAVVLHQFATRNAKVLGLDPDQVIAVVGFHPEFCQRADPDGSLHAEFVAQFVQSRKEPLFDDDPTSPPFDLWGGTTLIFDGSGAVRNVIAKPIGDSARVARQRDFLVTAAGDAPMAPFSKPFVPEVNLAALHRGFGGIGG